MFLTSKFSPAFWLTTERHLLAETGLFLGQRLSLGMSPGQRTGPAWLAQAFAGWTFSWSPPLGARLVACPALPSGRAGIYVRLSGRIIRGCWKVSATSTGPSSR